MPEQDPMTDKNSFAVVLCGTADTIMLSGILAKTLKLPRFEASKQTLQAPGIPARNLPEGQAYQLQSELRQNGIDSIIVRESDMPELPAAIPVRGARLDDDNLFLFEDTQREGKAWKLPWNLRLFLCCARVKITVEERKRELQRKSMTRYGGISGVAFRTDTGPVHETKIKKKTHSKIFFDMVPLGTAYHFRIIADDFNYLALGHDEPTVFESLTALILNISMRCDNPCRDVSIDNILDGDPLTNSAFPSPNAFENYVQRGVVGHLKDQRSSSI